MDVLDIDQATENMKKANVMAVTCGIHPKTNRIALELAQKYENVKCSLGLYPIDAFQTEINEKFEVDIAKELAWIEEHSDNMVAIGEIGLDYKTGKDKVAQKKLFVRQLELAKKLNKPVVIHSRKAEADAIEILEKFDLTVIMHCFSGKKKLVHRAMDNGYYFTVPTSVVKSQQYQYLAENVPLNRMFCETDSPYMSPYPDIPNEPAFVVESYKKISELRGLDIKEVENLIYNNFQRIE